MTIEAIVSVPAIVAIVYLACLAVRATPLDNKWLPVIAGCLGGGLGVLAYYVMPDFPAGDVLSAIAVGIASGLAATGANQVVKQLTGNNDRAEG